MLSPSERPKRYRLTSWSMILLSFSGVIAIGTLLLLLPFTHRGDLSFLDALFTATSAVCVTGLIVKDTPNDFTFWGQLIILILIQIGGLGYMTYVSFFSAALGYRTDLRQQQSVSEMLGFSSISDLLEFTKKVVMITFLFELVGWVLLTIFFKLNGYGFLRSLWFGLFHSISAFNNAGFSLFSNSLMNFVSSPFLNLVITALIIIGGIGFVVLEELSQIFRGKRRYITVHTRLVLISTASLLIIGFLFFLFNEWSNPRTLGELSLSGKLLGAWFHSVTPRTAGFNTLDVASLSLESKFFTIILMLIGGAPGGTAGGIKVTTFVVVLLASIAAFSNSEDVVVFSRRLPSQAILRALLLMGLSVIWIGVVTVILIHLEKRSLMDILFEVVSAYGTVGLSVGDGGARSLSALFSPLSKLLIIITMFTGRIGIMTFGLALLSKPKRRTKYLEAKVIVG